MPRPAERPTTYRLTHEFKLRYPRDYAFVRARFEQLFKQFENTTANYQPDYLSIEKVKEDDL